MKEKEYEEKLTKILYDLIPEIAETVIEEDSKTQFMMLNEISMRTLMLAMVAGMPDEKKGNEIYKRIPPIKEIKPLLKAFNSEFIRMMDCALKEYKVTMVPQGEE